jgi:hypothetical protein
MEEAEMTGKRRVVHVFVVLALMVTALLMSTATRPSPVEADPALVCEGFETGYTDGAELRTHADWFYGSGNDGPNTVSTVGFNGGWGLTDGDRIFTWVAHPFDWNGAIFQGIDLQMDFQTDGSGHFDDDRLGWMISNTSDSSSNIFGVQMDPGGSGASGYNIEGYWDGVSTADVRPSIVNLPALSADTWYRLRAEIRKLTATSASIDVELWSLDSGGNPVTRLVNGSIADTSALGANAPNSKYFTPTTMWPAYKNYTTAAAPADNACFEMMGSITIVKETHPAGASGFSFAGSLGTFSLDDGGSKEFGGVVPGDYDVTEVAASGWELDSAVCIGGDSSPITGGVTIHLDSGEDITCTFSNEELEQEGSITIVKETDPVVGAGFSFAGSLDTFTLDDGESQPFNGLTPGDYDVTEVATGGWYLDDVVCTGGDSDPITGGVTVHLEAGEDISCTFSNESYVYRFPWVLKR